MSDLINNKKNRSVIQVYPFIKKFINKQNLNIDLESSIISTSNNVILNNNIYVCKETHDNKNIVTNLYIDTIDNSEKKKKYGDKYFHVTWASISYSLRNVDKNQLLKPLKDIYNNKSKFCDYMFINKTYRNGKKRWDFFNILNNLMNVEQPKDNKRYTSNMFNNAVELHKPYRFSIAFENDIVDGWVTEKIINSFLAGCIPIYDGTDDIYKYFNKNSFINAKDFESLEELAEYVVSVDINPKIYNSYVKNSPTDIQKLQKLFWWDN